MSDEKANARKVKTGYFRMSFPHILTPKKDEETGRENFQLTMLHPPGTDLAPYKAALKAAMAEKFGTDTSKWPKLKRGPSDVLKDFAVYNAERDKPLPGDWTGWTMIRANSPLDHPPGVVQPKKGPDGKFPPVTDKRDVYGGRWARATIDAFFYDRKDGKGVTFGLANVQLSKHAETFGKGAARAEDDFDNQSEEWADGDDNWAADETKPAGAKGKPAADTSGDADWN